MTLAAHGVAFVHRTISAVPSARIPADHEADRRPSIEDSADTSDDLAAEGDAEQPHGTEAEPVDQVSDGPGVRTDVPARRAARSGAPTACRWCSACR